MYIIRKRRHFHGLCWFTRVYQLFSWGSNLTCTRTEHCMSCHFTKNFVAPLVLHEKLELLEISSKSLWLRAICTVLPAWKWHSPAWGGKPSKKTMSNQLLEPSSNHPPNKNIFMDGCWPSLPSVAGGSIPGNPTVKVKRVLRSLAPRVDDNGDGKNHQALGKSEKKNNNGNNNQNCGLNDSPQHKSS